MTDVGKRGGGASLPFFLEEGKVHSVSDTASVGYEGSEREENKCDTMTMDV